MFKISAIVLSAGRGFRMGGNTPKQYLEVGNLPVIVRTLNLFDISNLIEEVILVVDIPSLGFAREMVKEYPLKKLKAIVPGGQERSHSVYQGLEVVNKESSLVVVHDGVRPFFTLALLERVIEKAKSKGAAIPGMPVKDTIKICNEEGLVISTPEREKLWSIQTPQAFRKDWLMEAYHQAMGEGLIATDDAGLLERIGRPVHVVKGDYENIKLTTPEDLLLAEGILKRREKSCE